MIHRSRLTATLDGDFVVFLIGMRINAPLKVHKWWPVAAAMPRMLSELRARPELGFLHAEMWFARTILVLQYWRQGLEAAILAHAMRAAAPGRRTRCLPQIEDHGACRPASKRGYNRGAGPGEKIRLTMSRSRTTMTPKHPEEEQAWT